MGRPRAKSDCGRTGSAAWRPFGRLGVYYNGLREPEGKRNV
jgi:hypothetical protein